MHRFSALTVKVVEVKLEKNGGFTVEVYGIFMPGSSWWEGLGVKVEGRLVASSGLV